MNQKMNSNSSNTALAATLAFCCAFALFLAAKNVVAANSTSMTASFRDDSSATVPDAITSDGGGAYVNGQQNIKAIIDGSGNFDLDTSTNGPRNVRTVCLNFSYPASSGATPPFTSDCVDVYLSTGGNTGLLQMSVGTSEAKHLQIDFPGYFLDFNSNAQPGSSMVTVTRNSQTTWTIEADYPNAIAQLSKISTVNGKTVFINEGLFNMPFAITVQTAQ